MEIDTYFFVLKFLETNFVAFKKIIQIIPSISLWPLTPLDLH